MRQGLGDFVHRVITMGVDPSESVDPLTPVSQAGGGRNEGLVVIAKTQLNTRLFCLSVIGATLRARAGLGDRGGGPAENTIDDGNGWPVEAATVEAFVKGVRRRLEARGHRGGIGQADRTRALKRHTNEAMADRLLTVVGATPARDCGSSQTLQGLH